MTLHLQFEDTELPDLKVLLNRALNTWSNPPTWAIPLCDRVDAKLELLKADAEDAAEAALNDEYGNLLSGDRIINCCFPDCGWDGSRLCMAENGPSTSACCINIERGTALDPRLK